MMWTVLFGLGVWMVLSVPVAFLIGRILAFGSVSERSRMSSARLRGHQQAA